MREQELITLAALLFAINVVAFAWLALITLVRVLRFGPALWADLSDPGRVFGFFTIVAGSDVFGSGLSLRGLPAPALAVLSGLIASVTAEGLKRVVRVGTAPART